MSTSEEDVRAAVAGPDQPENNPWPARLDSFRKFSDTFHSRGTKIEKRYEDERESADMYTSGMSPGNKRVNMFYSNTTVIKESLYNSLPKPSVSRLHKGEWDNEAARVAALIVERALSYEVQCAPNFDAAVKAAILDRLVPGMGTLWVSFHAPGENGPHEYTSVDFVYWKDFLYEPARKWEEVTWAGRKLYYNKDAAKSRWGEKAVQDETTVKGDKSANDPIEKAIKEGKVCILQIWDKNTKTVIHMTPTGTILETVPDPYKLKAFFPTPKPLIACPPTRAFLPMTDYYMAQDQYLVMDILYGRINLIIEAIKVAGVYAADTTEIQRMLSGTENKLIPVDNWAMIAERGGIKGMIDWYPVEQVAQTLTHLVSAYEFVKTQLFEVTGMADIVRGSTNQYETAAAQQIKAQFASVRMNGFQRDVSTFVRDTLRIMAEVMCELYTDAKMQDIVGMLPDADQQYVMAAREIIRNDYMLYYNVDIEADSLTQADWGLQQEQRMAYGQSLSQFITAALPVAEANPALAPLLIQIIKFMSVGFKGSTELEGMLDNTLNQLQQAGQEPQPEQPDPEQVKAQLDIQKKQTEVESAQQLAAIRQQERQDEFEHNRRMNEQKLEYNRIEYAMKLEQQEREFVIKSKQQAVDAAMREARESHEFDREQEREDLRTNSSIVNEAAKTRAKTKSKKESDDAS